MRRRRCFERAPMDWKRTRVWTALLALQALYTHLTHAPHLPTLPLYFRVLLLFNLGLLCWITNLYILNRLGIQTHKLLSIRPTELRIDIAHLYTLNVLFTGLTLASLHTFLNYQLIYGEEYSEFIPLWTLILFLGFLVNPLRIGWHKERMDFWRSLKRIALGGLWDPVPFCDVVFADILTSFSRVAGDLQWAVSDLVLSNATESLIMPWLEFFIPFVVGLPFTFRLRQCVAEFHLSKDPMDRKRHLSNAIKYASAFPVVFTTYWINWQRRNYRNSDLELDQSASWNLHVAVALWIFFSIINSLYSLYWDIFVDWQLFSGGPLGLMSPLSPSLSYSKSLYTFLQRPLYFKHPLVYYLAILFNAVIRLFWLLKITLMYSVVDHLLQPKDTQDSAIPRLLLIDLALKVLEILRRWVWVFFRIEREWVMGGHTAVPVMVMEESRHAWDDHEIYPKE